MRKANKIFIIILISLCLVLLSGESSLALKGPIKYFFEKRRYSSRSSGVEVKKFEKGEIVIPCRFRESPYLPKILFPWQIKGLDNSPYVRQSLCLKKGEKIPSGFRLASFPYLKCYYAKRSFEIKIRRHDYSPPKAVVLTPDFPEYYRDRNDLFLSPSPLQEGICVVPEGVKIPFQYLGNYISKKLLHYAHTLPWKIPGVNADLVSSIPPTTSRGGGGDGSALAGQPWSSLAAYPASISHALSSGAITIDQAEGIMASQGLTALSALGQALGEAAKGEFQLAQMFGDRTKSCSFTCRMRLVMAADKAKRFPPGHSRHQKYKAKYQAIKEKSTCIAGSLIAIPTKAEDFMLPCEWDRPPFPNACLCGNLKNFRPQLKIIPEEVILSKDKKEKGILKVLFDPDGSTGPLPPQNVTPKAKISFSDSRIAYLKEYQWGSVSRGGNWVSVSRGGNWPIALVIEPLNSGFTKLIARYRGRTAEATIRVPESKLSLLFPNDGEILKKGELQEIKWRAHPEIERISLVLYQGKNFLGLIARNFPASLGKLFWLPGQGLEDGDNYSLGIFEYPFGSNSVFDYSDSCFSLVGEIPPEGVFRKLEVVIPEEVMIYKHYRPLAFYYFGSSKKNVSQETIFSTGSGCRVLRLPNRCSISCYPSAPPTVEIRAQYRDLIATGTLKIRNPFRK